MVNVEDVPVGPGKTSLLKGELVQLCTSQNEPKTRLMHNLRFIPRTEMDIAVVGCAVNLEIENDIIINARVSLGAVAPTALLLETAAEK